MYLSELPKIQPFTFNPGIELNTATVVSCIILRGKKPIVFQWLKDGKVISGDNNRLTIRNDNTFSSLEMRDLTIEDIGNYTCVAKNVHGSDQYTSPLLIKCKKFPKIFLFLNYFLISLTVSPMWIIKPESQSGTINGKISWICESSGFPPPFVKWEKYFG